jgi:glycosyltransferase involved in cell wall biosynthesis
VPLGALLARPDSRLHIVQKNWKFDLTVVPRLASLLKRLQADIVHGYLFDAEIAARLAGRMAGIPKVGNSERNTDYRFKRRQLLAHFVTRRCVDFYIANSNSGARFSQKALGNPPERYYTVHNGVDTGRFAPRDGKGVRASLGLPLDEFVVGMFGSFKAQKNYPLLFQAMRIVLDRRPGTRLLLVGDELAGGQHGSDEYKQRMLTLAKELGLLPHCVFAGNRADVESLYSACDVTALPSLFEGTPNVALESMACGVPVVATNVSDNAYVIRNGETGYLVDLGEAEAFASRVLELAQDPALREAMGRQGRRWVESEFSCARLAGKTEAVYLDVLGQVSPEAARLKSFRRATPAAG